MDVKNFDINDIHEAYYRHSGNLSVVLRQIIYAEGATVWFLLTFYKFSKLPCLALIFYIFVFIFFILDLAQYWYLTDAYGMLADHMINEKKYETLISDSKPKYQEFFPFSKKIMSIISSVLFIMFLINIMELY